MHSLETNTEVLESIKKEMKNAETFFNQVNPKPLTTEQVKYIYGSKGGLRLVLTQDTKKLSSKYKKVCEKIANKYRSLKIESSIEVMRQVTSEKIRLVKVQEDFNGAIQIIMSIIDVLNNKNTPYYTELKKDVDALNVKVKKHIETLSRFGAPAATASALVFPVYPEAIGVNIGVLASAMADLCDAIKLFSKQKKIAKFLESEDGKELRRLINAFIKQYPNVQKLLGMELEGEKLYQQNSTRYKEFVDSCGTLAYNYLKSESGSKMRHIKKGAKTWEIDRAKLVFMALICACSTQEKHKTYGKAIYKKVKNIALPLKSISNPT